MQTYPTEEEAIQAAAAFGIENESFSVPRMVIFRDWSGRYRYEGIGNSIFVATLQERIIDEGLELMGEVFPNAYKSSFFRFDQDQGEFVKERDL